MKIQIVKVLHYLCGGVTTPGKPYMPIMLSKGTGFLINKQGYIVTNHHVAMGGTTLVVYDGSLKRENQRVAKVVWASEAHDVAVIKVEGMRIAGTPSSAKRGPNDKRPLRYPMTLAVPELSKLVKGADVWSLGFPGASDIGSRLFMSLDPRLGKGNVVTVSEEKRLSARMKFTKFVDHTARVNPGNSGGPLIDYCGRVIAVNQSKIVRTSKTRLVGRTYYSVNISYVIAYLKSAGIPYRTSTRPCRVKKPVDTTVVKTTTIEKPIDKRIIITMTVAIGIFCLLLLWLFIQKRRQPQTSYSQLVRREFSRVIGRSPKGRGTGHSPANAGPSATASPAAGPRVSPPPPATDPVHTVRPGAHRSGDKIHGYLVGYGKLANIAVKLTGQQLVVGRDPSCDFQVDMKTVGRQHLLITWENGQFILEDLGSSNGTYLENGSKLMPGQRRPIQPGDKFYLATPENLLSLIPPQP